MNTIDHNTAIYESPAVLELGKAEALTLGTTGDCKDNCGCSNPRVPPLE